MKGWVGMFDVTKPKDVGSKSTMVSNVNELTTDSTSVTNVAHPFPSPTGLEGI